MIAERLHVVLEARAGNPGAKHQLGVLDEEAFIEIYVQCRRAELDVAGERLLIVIESPKLQASAVGVWSFIAEVDSQGGRAIVGPAAERLVRHVRDRRDEIDPDPPGA